MTIIRFLFHQTQTTSLWIQWTECSVLRTMEWFWHESNCCQVELASLRLTAIVIAHKFAVLLALSVCHHCACLIDRLVKFFCHFFCHRMRVLYVWLLCVGIRLLYRHITDTIYSQYMVLVYCTVKVLHFFLSDRQNGSLSFDDGGVLQADADYTLVLGSPCFS